MYIKKLKRKCSVRGCKCLDSYAISISSEIGNTVIACKSCLEKALETIEKEPQITEKQARKPQSPPPLFFNIPLKFNSQTDEISVDENYTNELVVTNNPDGTIADSSFGPKQDSNKSVKPKDINQDNDKERKASAKEKPTAKKQNVKK